MNDHSKPPQRVEMQYGIQLQSPALFRIRPQTRWDRIREFWTDVIEGVVTAALGCIVILIVGFMAVAVVLTLVEWATGGSRQ